MRYTSDVKKKKTHARIQNQINEIRKTRIFSFFSEILNVILFNKFNMCHNSRYSNYNIETSSVLY